MEQPSLLASPSHRKGGGVRSGRSTIKRHRRFKLPRRRRHLNVVLVVDRGRRQQVFHRFDVAGTLFADAWRWWTKTFRAFRRRIAATPRREEKWALRCRRWRRRRRRRCRWRFLRLRLGQVPATIQRTRPATSSVKTWCIGECGQGQPAGQSGEAATMRVRVGAGAGGRRNSTDWNKIITCKHDRLLISGKGYHSVQRNKYIQIPFSCLYGVGSILIIWVIVFTSKLEIAAID